MCPVTTAATLGERRPSRYSQIKRTVSLQVMAPPEILFPVQIVSTNRSNRKTRVAFHDYPIKSTIYEKVKGP